MPAKHPAAHALPAHLEDLPNVGRAVAADFRRLGIGTPDEIRGRDPYMLYHDLCRATRALVDPCMLDTFIAVVRYVDGGPAKPWWHYTAERKRFFPGSAKALAERRDAESGPADSKTVGPKPKTAGLKPKTVGLKPDPQAPGALVGRASARRSVGQASTRRPGDPAPRRPLSDPAEA